MTEKPIKVVIKLQMSPCSVFAAFQYEQRKHVALANCVRASGEHIHSNMIQNTFPSPIPPRCVGETLGEIHLFQLRLERTAIPLSLEGEGVLRTGLIPRSRAALKCIGTVRYLKKRGICRINRRGGSPRNRRPETHAHLQEWGCGDDIL